jgi:tRNA modification GTPase
MYKNNDTITAIATPPGRGGIGIIRVSGPLVPTIIMSVVKEAIPPRQAKYLHFCDAFDQPIDEGIVLFFPHPHSFTGEDVLELQGHGGPVVMDLLLQRMIQLGARLARPGEFSERAFLNGKIDLAQAEAIADLINASSAQAARSALRSLQGEFSQEMHALTNEVVNLRMYIEAAIDFVDEEIDFLAHPKIGVKLNDIIQHLATIQACAQQGSMLREGIRVVMVGQTNVGKSSLLNRLSGKDLAIVTPIAGTTRDVLRDYIFLDGLPIHIIDTAGLRESEDVIEQEGMRRTRQEMHEADILLYLQEATPTDVFQETPMKIPHDILQELPPHCPVIVVRNKIDLWQELPSIKEENDCIFVSLSAKEGSGMDLLQQSIKKSVGFQSANEGIFLARRRHLDALARAKNHLEAGYLLWQASSHSGELVAEDLRQAQYALNEITGEFSAEDLLGKIFSQFCIGK